MRTVSETTGTLLKHSTIHIIGVPEGKEKEKGPEKYLKILKLKTSLTWERKHSSPRRTDNPTQDEPKEEHAETHINKTEKI